MFGGFFTGHRTDYRLQLNWRPSYHLEFGFDGTLRQVRLPEGDFDARLVAAKAVYTVTPDLQFSVLAQYDNFSEQMGVNFRAKWTVKPGNDIFLIVNQGYDTSDENSACSETRLSLKGAGIFRF